jgi:hypothetical protein
MLLRRQGYCAAARNVSGLFCGASHIFFMPYEIREGRDRWVIENRGRREVDIQTLLAEDHHAHREKRVATEVEEVRLACGDGGIEHVRKDLSDRSLPIIARNCTGACARVIRRRRWRKRSAVDLVVDRSRDVLNPDICGGHHVLGQALCNVFS